MTVPMILISNNSVAKRVSLHFLFWISYILIFTFQSGYTSNSYIRPLLSYCLYSPLIIIASYFTCYYIIPKYLFTKKYLQFVLILISSAFLFVVLQRLMIFYVTAPLLYTAQGLASVRSYSIFNPASVISHLFSMYSIVGIMAFIKMVKKWLEEQKLNQNILQEKLESEINFLKSQIHPHFLFNLLNNLYSLTLKKSDLAPEMILKLSSLLDFMLYHSNMKSITLDKEITLINDFLAIEKIRYSDKLNVEFNIEGDYQGLQISPLLLFPFIENAFKHGASTQIQSSYIKISIRMESGILNLFVENTKNKEIKRSDVKGLGLKNVQRRLELIYPNKHILNISEKTDLYTINLKIDLCNEN